MKVGLVNAPVSVVTDHSKMDPPLGLAYVGSYLISEGYRVFGLDMNLGGLNFQRVERLIDKGVEVVGVSSQTESFPNALKIADKIKSINENVKVVFGGPHPSLKPKEALSNENVDYVVMGEGEKTFVELIDQLSGEDDVDASDVNGVALKKNGVFLINDNRDPVDLDNLLRPARELFPLRFYDQPWTVLTSRGGCPFECPFCSAPKIWENEKRYRNPKDILDEIEFLVQNKNARFVFLVDDTLTINKQWTQNLLRKLEQSEFDFNWGCSTRIDQVDKNLLRKMNEANCVSIQFGMETGSQELLNSIKGGIDKDEALEKVKLAEDIGIDTACTFMFPHPNDTVETLKETKEFMNNISEAGSKVLLSCTSPFPGTEYRERANEFGIDILTNDWNKYDAKHIVFETENFSKQELEELLNELVNEVGLKSRNELDEEIFV